MSILINLTKAFLYVSAANEAFILIDDLMGINAHLLF